MSGILIPKIHCAEIPDDWQSFLNDPGGYGWCLTNDPDDWQGPGLIPKRHWRDGRSAQETAYNWDCAGRLTDRLPPEIAKPFGGCPELLFAIPEHKVKMPARRRQPYSQSDVFALVRSDDQLIAMAVEAIYKESFGGLVKKWLTQGDKDNRDYLLRRICDLLEINHAPNHLQYQNLRYQLFHRTASAIIEARRFQADMAMVIIQSFSHTHMHYQDFANFCSYLGVGSAPSGLPGKFRYKTLSDGLPLGFAWVTSQMRHNKP